MIGTCTSLPVLYHGTDARIIRMSEEERMSFGQDCRAIVDSLWPFYKQLMDTEFIPSQIPGKPPFRRKIERYKALFGYDDYHNLIEKVHMVDNMKSGCEYYQYGSLYLTSEKNKAANYARRSFAFGEIGLIACRFLSGARTIGFKDWHPDDTLSEAINRFDSFSSNEQNNCPVVIQIKDYDINLLINEDGSPLMIFDGRLISQNFRYMGPLSLNLSEAIYLKSERFKEWLEEQ